MFDTKVTHIFSHTFLLLSTLIFISEVRAQDLVINEFLASNSAILPDPDYGEYADWIELYNASVYPIDIDGYYITDDIDDATKWPLPGEIVIEPGGYLLLWADSKHEQGNGYHTNFKLSKEGEEIGLFYYSGALVGSVTYSTQETDISFGRRPDGTSNWVQFGIPTPGAANASEVHLRAPAPVFSLDGGFFTTEQELVLTGPTPDAVIRYTLDGYEPTETSMCYSEAIPIRSRRGDPNVFSMIRTNIDPPQWLPDWVPPRGEVFKATVVRARTFIPGHQPSDIVTKTYFVDPDIFRRYTNIAVVSIVSDYRHLFDPDSGIYVPGNTYRPGDSDSGNYFQDWERSAHIEFFEPSGNTGFSQDVGIRIQGGSSPASPQKGLHVIARSRYGNNRIRYPIFNNSRSRADTLEKFKRFMIRSWGSTLLAGLFNDAYGHRLMEHSGMDIQAYRPAVVFLN